jgi:pimeloyl-ACP methyl ester carboxylesterase
MAGIKIDGLKRATKAILFLFVISVQGQFVEDNLAAPVALHLKPVVDKTVHYLPGTTLESISFVTKENEESKKTFIRHGFLKLKKDAPATILICHGYSVDKYDAAFSRLVFTDYNVMTFDFRAHGHKKENQCCTFGKEEAFDVIAAVDYLRSRPEIAGKPLLVYAFSMGAVSAIEAQAKRPDLFDGMVLDSPFDSSENLIKTGLDHKIKLLGYEFNMPGREFLKQYAYHPYVQSLLKMALKLNSPMDATLANTKIVPVHPADSIEKVTVPCYFITCKNDEKVPVSSVVSVYAGAKGYKRLWITNGPRHCYSFFNNPEKYIYKVNKFVKGVVVGSLANDNSTRITQDPEE